jgi:acylphosphatase
LRAVVHGDVQGVGYRAYIQYHASRLGISGYARNEWDGTVEVIAEGERHALETLIEKLHKGPRGAFVDRVDLLWSEPTGEFKYFGVRY